MQHGEVGDVGPVADRLAQRHRAVGGQLGNEPVGQRLHAFVLLRLGRGRQIVGGDVLAAIVRDREGAGLVRHLLLRLRLDR